MENNDLKIIQRYRRRVSKDPRGKGLVRVRDDQDRSALFGAKRGRLYGRTMFFLLARGESLYWAKNHYGTHSDEELHSEYAAALQAPGGRVVRPLDIHPEFGLLFPFRGDIYRSTIVHYDDRRKWLSPQQIEDVDQFARSEIQTPTGKKTLKQATDFQVAMKPDGDFEYIDLCAWPREYKPGGWVRLVQEMRLK